MWRLFGASLWASWYSSEASYVNDVAVLVTAQSPGEFPAVNAVDCHAKLKDLKELVHQSRKKRHAAHYGTVDTYPSAWEEFRSMYPTIFEAAYPDFQLDDPATGPQTPCPINEAILNMVRAQIPARISHRSVTQGPLGRRYVPKISNADANVRQMQACFQNMMAAAMQQPRAGEENLLRGFRMLRGAFNLLSNYSVVVVLSADVFVSYSETSVTA